MLIKSNLNEKDIFLEHEQQDNHTNIKINSSYTIIRDFMSLLMLEVSQEF